MQTIEFLQEKDEGNTPYVGPAEKLINKFKLDSIKLVNRQIRKTLVMKRRLEKLDKDKKEHQFEWDQICYDIYCILDDMKPLHDLMDDLYPGTLVIYNELKMTIFN